MNTIQDLPLIRSYHHESNAETNPRNKLPFENIDIPGFNFKEDGFEKYSND